MIHDNFKKLIRRYITLGNSSDSETVKCYNYTDITGYTPAELSDNDSMWRQLNITYPCIMSSSNYIRTKRNILDALTFVTNSSSGDNEFFIAIIGNSIEFNEPEYSLGQILTSGLSVNASSSKEDELIYTTIIYNETDSDITFNEIGFIKHHGMSASSYKWNGSVPGALENKLQLNFLLIKEVLPQPMTLPAQSSINIAFNLFGDTPASLTVS